MWRSDRKPSRAAGEIRVPKNSDAKTYYAVIDHNMPVRVTISDGNGNVLDGYEINTNNSIQYGNEKISTMESGPLGGFSYTAGRLSFQAPWRCGINSAATRASASCVGKRC